MEKDRGALAGSRRSQGSLSGGLVGLARKARANCCFRRRITCWVSVVSAAFVIAASVFSLSLSSCAEQAGWAECQMSHLKLIFRSLFFFFFSETQAVSPHAINYPKTLQRFQENDIFSPLFTASCTLLGFSFLVELRFIAPSAHLENMRTKHLTHPESIDHLKNRKLALCL